MKVEYKIKNINEIFFYGTIDDDDMKSNFTIFPINKFHGGYLKQWLLVQDEIYDYIDSIEKEYNHVVISGHSLGGGIARIAVIFLQVFYPNISITLNTYGTPRSYTWSHRKTLSKLKVECNEYINRGDLIPRIPTLFPFF